MTVVEQIEGVYLLFKDRLEKAEQECEQAEQARDQAVQDCKQVEQECGQARLQTLETIKNFLRAGTDKEFIAKNFGKTLAEIEAIAAEL